MSVDDKVVTLRGEGEDITVDVPSVSTAYRMVRDIGGLSVARRRLAVLSGILPSLGFSIVIRTPSRRLMTLGETRGSPLMRLLGVPNARLHLS